VLGSGQADSGKAVGDRPGVVLRGSTMSIQKGAEFGVDWFGAGS
jgi:hypothetical protein